MKLKVLIDNNTYIDEYVLGEPALAFYLEHNDKRILFDTGYSDALINNAKTYNIDFNKLDYLILSHAHNDHTRGLNYLMEQFDLTNTTLIVNPAIFSPRQHDGLAIGMVNTKEELESKMKVKYVESSFEIMDNLWLITDIKSYNTFENQRPVGQKYVDNQWYDDDMAEECALVYHDKTLNIITGCSHRGICNLLEQAKHDLGVNKINSIIGGFHLFAVDDVLQQTVACFKDHAIKYLYPCHCVSFKAKAYLNHSFNINEVGVGLTIDYDELR